MRNITAMALACTQSLAQLPNGRCEETIREASRWNTVLIEAAIANDIAAMSHAVQEGASVNAREPKLGMTALHKAAMMGKEQAVKWLLSQPGINPTIEDDYGRIAVGLAWDYGHRDAIYDALADVSFVHEEVENTCSFDIPSPSNDD